MPNFFYFFPFSFAGPVISRLKLKIEAAEDSCKFGLDKHKNLQWELNVIPRNILIIPEIIIIIIIIIITKLYMHNPAPVLENATHKLLWDVNIQTDHLIPVRRRDLIIINQKKKQNSRLC